MFKLTVSSLLFMNKPTKNMTNSIMGLLLCAGLLSVPTYTWATQTDPIEQTVAFKTCRQEISNSDNRYLGSMIQHQLVSLYKTNSEFKKQFTKDSKAFTDGIIGPQTQYWLAYFCGDFSFTAPPATDHYHLRFMQALLMDLSRAYQLNTLFPTWRTKIKPVELLQMTPQQIMQKLGLTSVQSNNNSSVKGELNNTVAKIPDSDTRPYYYQLTDKDFANLTLRQSILETFTKLEKQQFDQRTQLYNQLTDLFTQLDLPKEQVINIDTLIESHTIETKQPSATSTTSTSSSEITQLPKEEESTASKGNQTVQTTTQSESQTTAPQLVWQINAVALNNALQQFNIVALSKEELTTLSPLVNEVFPSLYLMEVAVKLTGISPNLLHKNGAFDVAKKGGHAQLTPSAMQWNAPANCGCEDSLASIFSMGTFYGFYPYWMHPEKGQTINFSRLDRIGYIGAVMKPGKSGNFLELPQNWLATPKFSQFIQTAHRYRSDIDLVVTTPRNLSRQQLTSLFTDTMVKRLVAAVTTPLDGYVSNQIKPWISFGFKAIPTMADGITLDMDLSILDTAESQHQFYLFIRDLKLALRQSYEKQLMVSERTISADVSDRYYLNIIVPIKDLIETNNSIFNFDNLNVAAPITNLFIMRPSSPEAIDQTDELTQIQQLQVWLSHQANQHNAKQLFKKMVPMLITEDNRDKKQGLDRLINLSSWSFLGAAYWPIPLDKANEKLIDQTFYPTQATLPQPLAQIVQGINTVFNWVCPNRWLLRTSLFISFTLIIVLLVIAVWNYPLRKYLSRLPFVALSTISVIGLMLVLVADPVFEEYQGPILLIFTVLFGSILFAVRIVRKEGDKP